MSEEGFNILQVDDGGSAVQHTLRSRVMRGAWFCFRSMSHRMTRLTSAPVGSTGEN